MAVYRVNFKGYVDMDADSEENARLFVSDLVGNDEDRIEVITSVVKMELEPLE